MKEPLTVKEQLDDIRHKLDLLQEHLVDYQDVIADDAPISDMLSYMVELERRHGSIGDNFYNTIQRHLHTQLIGIGQYDMPDGIILRLTDEVGLQILPLYQSVGDACAEGGEYHHIRLDLRFVPCPEKNWVGEPVVLPYPEWTEKIGYVEIEDCD